MDILGQVILITYFVGLIVLFICGAFLTVAEIRKKVIEIRKDQEPTTEKWNIKADYGNSHEIYGKEGGKILDKAYYIWDIMTDSEKCELEKKLATYRRSDSEIRKNVRETLGL